MCFEVGAMLRRDFISFLAVTLVAGSRVAIAQTPSKVYRVGTVFPSAPLDEKSPLGAVLLKKLEQHGYTLGKNLAFEARGAGGQVSKLGEIVNGMKANGVDVIVATGFPTTLACKVANVPTVVFFGVGDPVATRLIDSLARPGGNITGISDNAAALATKRLELIKQAVPKVRRVAMLWNRNDLGMSMRYDASADVARSMGCEVPFIRPAELALDRTPHLPVMQHAVEWLAANDDYRPDLVLILQPTSPLRRAEHVREAVSLAQTSGADSVVGVSAVPVHYHPLRTLRVDPDGTAVLFVSGKSVRHRDKRRQDLPPVWAMNGAIYVFRTGTLFDPEPSLFGERSVAYPMPHPSGLSIDDPDDWTEAERHLAQAMREHARG